MSATQAAAPVLVSLHMAKTAGTSFKVALREHFGDALAEEYGVLPMNQKRGWREWHAVREGLRARSRPSPDVRAIHGHFLPVQYAIALRGREVAFATWLRDPVQRLLSHYHYWKRTAARALPQQPLRYRVVHEDWSLQRFCLGPELRNYYRQHLWAFPRTRFAFIGITERYETDLQRFAQRFLGGEAVLAHDRENPERAVAGYDVAPGLRDRIEAWHAWDAGLYRWARDRAW